MKKIICLVLVLSTLAMMMVSCGDSEETENNYPSGGSSTGGSQNISEYDEMFAETFDVTEEKQVSLSFCGENGYVKSIALSVNGFENDSINVTEISDKICQTKDGAYSDDPSFGFMSKDMNFDGFCDFAIQAWVNENGTVPYFCWTWNPDKNIFEYAFQIESPVFDEKNAKIYSTTSDGTNEYIDVFSLADNVLTPEYSFSVPATVDFQTDLSAYEPYMAPAAEARDSYLLLVNGEHTLDAGYVPEDLTGIANTRNDGREIQRMRYPAAVALDALYLEMNAAGYTDVSVTSAYRAYDYQERLFNSYINQEMSENGYTYDEAKEIVMTYSAVPGTSEHQSGLCCDMHNLGEADQAFANKPVYQWLTENSWKFGFILRFPEDKQDITNITFEPWHYRFVGRYHAAKIHGLGLCLEEYIDLFINN